MPQKSRFAVPLEAKTRLTGDGRLRQSTCSELAEHLRGYCISKFYNYSLNKRNFMSACPLLQGSAKRLKPGLVKFVPAVAYHFCLNLPGAFTKPGQSLLAEPCGWELCPWTLEDVFRGSKGDRNRPLPAPERAWLGMPAVAEPLLLLFPHYKDSSLTPFAMHLIKSSQPQTQMPLWKM